MKVKVKKVKVGKPNKKSGKPISSKVGAAQMPTGKPRMRSGHSSAPYKVK